jgi:hypothetical protein
MFGAALDFPQHLEQARDGLQRASAANEVLAP